jgi:ATP adenylyltransferase
MEKGGLMEYFFNFNKLGYLKKGKSSECVLCLVRDGSNAVERMVVFETLHSLVSLNLYPYNPGHLLVFPKRHCLDLRELTHEERLDIDSVVDECLDILDEIFKPAGYNLGYNLGSAAGGSIDHVHMHIIPRYKNEIGIAELLGGKKVLVQDPRETFSLLKSAFDARGKHEDK